MCFRLYRSLVLFRIYPFSSRLSRNIRFSIVQCVFSKVLQVSEVLYFMNRSMEELSVEAVSRDVNWYFSWQNSTGFILSFFNKSLRQLPLYAVWDLSLVDKKSVSRSRVYRLNTCWIQFWLQAVFIYVLFNYIWL